MTVILQAEALTCESSKLYVAKSIFVRLSTWLTYIIDCLRIVWNGTTDDPIMPLQ